MTLALVRSLAAPLLILTVAARAPCQALQLDVQGGSTPGSFALDLYPGLFPFEFAAIVPSFTPGPTPLSLVDPGDPRSLAVGSELLSAVWFGYMGLNGHLNIGPVAVASVPNFQDLPIFFQGVSIQGWPTIVDRISNPNVIRLGISGAFRDRVVTFQDDRAFATVLPRTDNRWMVAGGARGALLAQQAHDTTSIYDPLDDTFSPGPAMTAPRSMHTQTRLNDGRWLLIGGVSATNDPQATCEVYDPVADAFAAVASMSIPRMGHTATPLGDGRVLVTGGLDAVTTMPTPLSAVRDAVDSTEIYDPVADTWTPGPNMSDPRAAHGAVLRPDGTVLLAGGISWYSVIIIGWLPTVRTSCDIYDPVTNSMSSGPSMANARSFAEPISLNNDRWLFAGGINSLTLTNLGTPTNTAEIYNAAANSWTSVGSMTAARAFQKGWPLGNGNFMLVGGAGGNILTPVPTAAVEVFSTATNLFSPGPAMTNPRAAPAFHLTPQGQVMLFGGGSTNNAITNTTEFYYY